MVIRFVLTSESSDGDHGVAGPLEWEGSLPDDGGVVDFGTAGHLTCLAPGLRLRIDTGDLAERLAKAEGYLDGRDQQEFG